MSSSAYKTVAKSVLSKEQAEGVGARVRRSIGTYELRNLDPFLMLDEFTVKEPAGFPDHPHRGFETVTYMIEGEWHEDFTGRKGRIQPGDLQWMTAGRGIVHAEMPLGDTPARGLQLWVNLPRSAKMIPPHYQELLDGDVPRATADGVVVKVIAGKSIGVDAKVLTYSPIQYLDVKMEPGKVFEHEIPAGWTAFIYTLVGDIKVGGSDSTAEPHTTVVLSKTGDILKVESCSEKAHFVIIAGEPINEPIVQHGPFVMNETREIQQAMFDYQMGQNGFENAAAWASEIGKKRIR
ncbi:RmlC-like cupin domain-containing protein [Blyttiomyces helicus]|uniref:RmlC-like cupin domain-containing protein n=1 Tax=Blyttiomyces helicus TaxID=388810 RepID=A0A4P9W7V5_9FUNG|nr:RmlC-like cupin domain-containing protein [Blyttiomyces helicus]|eukprot:RKO88569.1 RmlC-like cupin domain-containing protein [Blyttiomyces helicus]